MALDMYLDNVKRASESKFEYSLWTSWGLGADEIFKRFNDIPRCAMNPDASDKANLLLEAGIQPMISIWYHQLESQESHSVEEKELARKIALRNTQSFLAVPSEGSIRLYLGFGKELQVLLDGKRTWCGYYVSMFYQRCCECITGKQIVDWDKLQFPIESFQQFLETCHKGKYHDFEDPITGVLQAWAAITYAGILMLRLFKKLYQKD